MVRIELVQVRLPMGPRRELAARLTLDRGGINVLLGGAADGGSTCLDVIAGSVRPAGGRVLFDDCDVTRDGPVRRNVARSFAEPAVYPTLSVQGNLELPIRRRNGGRATAPARVAAIAEVLDLGDALARRVATLTRSARRRVAIGRAFARADAAAILLDDPLQGADPRERAGLRTAILALAAEVRSTLVWATGDVDDVLSVAQRVVVLEGGRVVQDGAPDELLAAPATTLLAARLGDPPMNLLACEVRAERLRVGAAQLDLPAAVATARVQPAGTLQLGIRPDDLRIVAAPRPNTLVAQLQAVEHRGAYKVATFRVDALSLRLVCEVTQQLVPGYRYHLEFPPESTRLYADGVLQHV